VECEGQLVKGLDSGKALALLGYLTIQDQPVPRERLADLFWPDKTTDRGRANLSWLVHYIKKRIPGCLETNKQTVRFQRISSICLDLDDFEELVSLGDVPSQKAAAEIYRGDLMDGLQLDGCAYFETWLVGEREHWHWQAVQVLKELVSYYDRSGQYKQGLHYARRLLAMEPWMEETHRQVIRMLAVDGQQEAAAAQYEICRDVLVEELGVEPTLETTQLYEQIRAGKQLESVLPSAPTFTFDLTTQRLPTQGQTELTDEHESERSVFVLRHKELASLEEHLASALAGQGHVVFVTGEAGSGKTALIHEFAQHAQSAHPDLVVAFSKGGAYTGIGDPYLPFRELLNLLTGDIDPRWVAGAVTQEQALRLWHTMPLTSQALVEIGPDLIDTFVPGSKLVQRAIAYAPRGANWLSQLEKLVELKLTHPPDPTLQQIALFRQFTRVLHALASRRGLMLVLDDLQWADAGSVSLLFHLGRELAGHRIFIMGAYRPTEVLFDWSTSNLISPQSAGRYETEIEQKLHPLASIINEFKRTYGDIEVSLAADDPSFVDAFLDTVPNQLSGAFRQTLYYQTSGNPLFTIELLHGMQERGDLVMDEAGRWIEGPDLDWETIPERVESVIAERISRLPTYLQGILVTASVEGETFTAEVVAQVEKFDQEEMLRTMSSQLGRQYHLVRAQEVHQVDGQRLSKYRFRHILFQKFLYGKLDPVEKSHLHQKVGTAMETFYAASVDETAAISGQLARHFQEGGVPEKAVAYLLQAGQRAMQLSAHEEAIAHFTRGLELLELLPETPARNQQELALQVGLAVPLLSSKGYASPEVGRTYTRALELCNQLEQTEQLFPLLWLSYSFHAAKGEHRTAYDIAKQLLSLAESAEDPTLLALARWALGWNRFFHGELFQGLSLVEQVVAFYDPNRHHYLAYLYGQDPGIASLLFTSWMLCLLGYSQRALDQCQKGLTLAEELYHPMTLAFAQFVASGCYMLCGDVQMTLELAETCIQNSSENGLTYFMSAGKLFRGWALTEMGQIKEGIEEFRHGIASYKASGAKTGLSQQLGLLADVYRKSGKLDEGLLLLDEALDFVKLSGERFFEAEIYRLRGELLLIQAGDDAFIEPNYHKAEKCFQKAIEISRRQKAKKWELRATVSLARLWGRLGTPEPGRKILSEIYNWFTEGFETPDLRSARALLDEFTASSEKTVD